MIIYRLITTSLLILFIDKLYSTSDKEVREESVQKSLAKKVKASTTENPVQPKALEGAKCERGGGPLNMKSAIYTNQQFASTMNM